MNMAGGEMAISTSPIPKRILTRGFSSKSRGITGRHWFPLRE